MQLGELGNSVTDLSDDGASEFGNLVDTGGQAVVSSAKKKKFLVKDGDGIIKHFLNYKLANLDNILVWKSSAETFRIIKLRRSTAVICSTR